MTRNLNLSSFVLAAVVSMTGLGCGKGTDDQKAAAPSAVKVESDQHGPHVADSAERCAKHDLPVSKCAFCDPSLVEKLGFCGAHDVAEAWCTRCSPVLIAAFKKEGDWCQEHGLPMSQCKVCEGRSESGSQVP